MSKLKFDPVIHAPKRLQICALLVSLEEAEFRVLREELGVSESVLSKQISRLKEAGYVRLRGAAVNGRKRKWAGLTTKGRRAFAAHVEALRSLAGLAESE